MWTRLLPPAALAASSARWPVAGGCTCGGVRCAGMSAAATARRPSTRRRTTATPVTRWCRATSPGRTGAGTTGPRSPARFQSSQPPRATPPTSRRLVRRAGFLRTGATSSTADRSALPDGGITRAGAVSWQFEGVDTMVPRSARATSLARWLEVMSGAAPAHSSPANLLPASTRSTRSSASTSRSAIHAASSVEPSSSSVSSPPTTWAR